MLKNRNKTLSQLFLLLIISFTSGCSSSLTKGEVEKIQSEFSFTEGPAVNKDGEVYFTDQPNDRIYIWNENEGISLYKESVGRSNGLYFNANNELVACADEFNQLAYFDDEKQLHVIHENFNGKHLNAPNDLWIAPNGGIYFTDPYYHRPWWPESHKMIQETEGVYYLSPEGELSRIIDDFEKPNGIIGTPDGKTLYVADIKAEKIWKYDINKDGSISNKTFFAPNGSDGMTIDNKGNVYLTTGNVLVYNPEGKLIETIETPELPANVCFGGKKHNILFITARTSIYTIEMNVIGVK